LQLAAVHRSSRLSLSRRHPIGDVG